MCVCVCVHDTLAATCMRTSYIVYHVERWCVCVCVRLESAHIVFETRFRIFRLPGENRLGFGGGDDDEGSSVGIKSLEWETASK